MNAQYWLGIHNMYVTVFLLEREMATNHDGGCLKEKQKRIKDRDQD